MWRKINFKITKVKPVYPRADEKTLWDVVMDVTVKPLVDLSTFDTVPTKEDLDAMMSYFKGGWIERQTEAAMAELRIKREQEAQRLASKSQKRKNKGRRK